MIQNPKMVFEIGYFPVNRRGDAALVLFRVLHANMRGFTPPDAEDSTRFAPFNASNGVRVETNYGPTCHPGHIQIPSLSYIGCTYEIQTCESAAAEVPRAIEALSEWASEKNPLWNGDIYVDDPDEPRAPVVIEPYQLYKFILP